MAASLGSFLVLLAVLMVSIKVRDTMAILIIGLMFASITAAIVSVLSYFGSAEQLQQYIFWGFGSLGDLQWNEVRIFAFIYAIGILFSVISIKALNTLLLGENYAKSLGLVFALPEELRPIYLSFGINVEAHNGEDQFDLPLAATFVIKQDGTIASAFVEADYTLRQEPSEVIEVLKSL